MTPCELCGGTGIVLDNDWIELECPRCGPNGHGLPQPLEEEDSTSLWECWAQQEVVEPPPAFEWDVSSNHEIDEVRT